MARSSGFSLEEIDAALEAAGVSVEAREQVQQTLSGIRRPPGRPPEEDDALLMAVAELVSRGLNPHAAAVRVTEHMADPPRTTTQKRLYKKYMRDPKLWQQKVDQPRRERLESWRESTQLHRQRSEERRRKLDQLFEDLGEQLSEKE
jgi:hypothetical protein